MPAPRSRAFTAVLEHHRCWLSSDGAYLAMVGDSGLSTEIAGAIAKDYQVVRNIGKQHWVEQLAARIRSVSDDKWCTSLIGRFEICQELGQLHQKGGAFHAPLSGITKLMWFLRPHGWTMYDRLARIGLVGRSGNGETFYQKLDECGFVECAGSITDRCRTLKLPLFGERVIDKFLMLRGMSDVASGWTATLTHHHFTMLPRERQKQLEAIAAFVEDLDLEQKFPPPIARRRKRENTSPNSIPGTPA
jgi:hypothetical protein